MSLKHALCWYLKRFRTAETNENNVSKACIVTLFKRFETVEISGKHGR